MGNTQDEWQKVRGSHRQWTKEGQVGKKGERKKRDTEAKTQSNRKRVKKPVSVNWHPRDGAAILALLPCWGLASLLHHVALIEQVTNSRLVCDKWWQMLPVRSLFCRWSNNQVANQERRRGGGVHLHLNLSVSCVIRSFLNALPPKKTVCSLQKNVAAQAHESQRFVALTRWEQKGALTKTKKTELRRTVMRYRDNIEGFVALHSVSADASSSAALRPVGRQVTARRNNAVKDHCSVLRESSISRKSCGFFLNFHPPPSSLPSPSPHTLWVFIKRDCLRLLKENENKNALQSQKKWSLIYSRSTNNSKTVKLFQLLI